MKLEVLSLKLDLFSFRGFEVSARIVQNVISGLLEVYLQKGHLLHFGILSQTTKASQIESHIVKFLETEFRLKGFAELFSKSDKEKSISGHLFRKGAKKKTGPTFSKRGGKMSSKNHVWRTLLRQKKTALGSRGRSNTTIVTD